MYERDTLRFAPTRVIQVWKTKSEQRSLQYPTCWGDLLEVSSNKKSLAKQGFFCLERKALQTKPIISLLLRLHPQVEESSDFLIHRYKVSEHPTLRDG